MERKLFELPGGFRFSVKTPEEFVYVICGSHILTQGKTVEECMQDYALLAKEQFNIQLPTSNARDFANALVRLRYVKWIR